ncbi:uncharacterized protein LOC120629991, partial [Pararge aegeria]|uniref:uncharacterized protein LOC120629991 n=1 Tax=Pararge aegeria TaxID=116150 RepID=UPI0019D2B1A8
ARLGHGGRVARAARRRPRARRAPRAARRARAAAAAAPPLRAHAGHARRAARRHGPAVLARAWDMEAVWRALPDDDRARAERLEPLDERELLQQLHRHYALTLATRGALLADMDLLC